MNIDLSNRVVVTGRSSSIGAVIAKMAAQCRARVAVTARDDNEIRKVISAIEYAGGLAMAVRANATSSEEVNATLDKIVRSCGRINDVVVNAGINGTWAPI
jgi:NAD(P)-dependent dehydrogenase (short-subunit alcohol dehydrogenase family)